MSNWPLGIISSAGGGASGFALWSWGLNTRAVDYLMVPVQSFHELSVHQRIIRSGRFTVLRSSLMQHLLQRRSC